MDKKLKKELEIMNSQQGWDFLAEKKEETETDADFGRIFGFRGRPAFDWRPYLPVFEDQKRSVYCLLFSLLNGIETITIKRYFDKYKNTPLEKLKKEINFSERWLAAHINFSNRGTSFKTAISSARDNKLIKDIDCPFKPEWLENPNAYIKQIKDVAEVKRKIENGEIKTFKAPNYSKVYSSIAGLSDALHDTPLWIGVGVGANWENEVVSKPSRYYAYHGVMLAYIDDKYKYIMDNLGRPIKKLKLDYPILYAYSYKNLVEGWELLNKMLKRIIYNNTEQYSLDDENIINRIPDESTLDFLLDKKVISKEMKPVSSLEGYTTGKDWASQKVYEKARDFIRDDDLNDAYRIAREIKAGKINKEELAWFKEIWEKFKGLFS